MSDQRINLAEMRTTGLVARRHGRHAILIELNGDYCRMAAERTQQLSVLA